MTPDGRVVDVKVMALLTKFLPAIGGLLLAVGAGAVAGSRADRRTPSDRLLVRKCRTDAAAPSDPA